MSTHGRAFTLIEAITTMTIVAVLVVITAPIIANGANGYAAAATRAEIVSDASAAMERIATEVRDIPLRLGAASAEPHIDSVTTGSLAWSSTSTLALSGSHLQLTIAGGTARTLVRNVQTFGVQALDANGAALAATLSGDACDAIRRLQISLTISRGGTTETLRTRMFLRCMMTGAAP